MRPAGFALGALLVGVAVAAAQPPGGPAAPGTPPGMPPAAPGAKAPAVPATPGAPGAVPGQPPAGAQPPGGAQPPAAAPPAGQPQPGAADPKLDAHLAGWEKTMGGITNFRFELGLTRKDPVFQKPKEYTGLVLGMKPNYAIVRLDYTGDPKKEDYEAFTCDGKAVYAYNGLERTITEFKLPDPAKNPGGATDNLMIDFLSGMKAKDAKQRFELKLYNEDQHYVYLDIKPILGKDKQEFQQLRLALYGPNTKFAYLPAQVYMVKPNGDTEMWKFTNPQTNLPGIDAKTFAYKDVPGFRKIVAQPQPVPPGPPGRPMQPMVPGGPGLPAGPGAVRPNP